MIRELVLNEVMNFYQKSPLPARYIIIHADTYEKLWEEEKVHFNVSHTAKGVARFMGCKFVKTRDIHEKEIIVV